VIGVVANFIHYKGHTIFFEAWSDVLQKYPHAVALLVGDGVLRTEVETKAAQMGLMPSLRFLGVRDDVPKLLALVDIYVHPSLQEGHSNAILEAMAAAKPVVACAVGGNVETVTAGQTGLLVPPGDSRALAEAIIRLLDNPDEATRFGAAARRVVAERFDERTMAARYEEVYERLVAEKTEGRVRVPVPIPFPPSTQTAATIEGRSGHVRDRGQD
jgi:glycosyltransferase involved in cell wall biosynthesis